MSHVHVLQEKLESAFLIENNSGTILSGVKGVLCEFEIIASAFSIFIHFKENQ